MSRSVAQRAGDRLGKWPALGVSLVLVVAAAATGGAFPPGEWYAGLAKPSFNPPNWVFGPAWTYLYLTMAIAAWLVWLWRDRPRAGLALGFYLSTLLLNALWMPLFFGVHWMGIAFAEIVLLDVCIVACIVLFWPVSRVASLLMVPYAAWVTFAATLNFWLWRLNPGA